MNNELLKEVFLNSQAQNNFEPNRLKWPWLSNIQFDNNTIEIVDVKGELRKSEKVSFDCTLLDGSNLTDLKNRELYGLLLEYTELYRLHNPTVGASVHVQRIKALMLFISWLSQHRIRSLRNVTHGQVDLYAETVAMGAEMVLDIPKKVFNYLKSQIIMGKGLVRAIDGRIRRGTLYKLVGVDHYPTKPNVYTNLVVSWFENQINHDFEGVNLAKIDFENALEEMDFSPRISTKQEIHRKLVPLEEIWAWQYEFNSKSFSQAPFLSSSAKVAQRLGTEAQRTKTIPLKVAIATIKESSEWVLNYSEAILELYESDADVETAQQKLQILGLNKSIKKGKQNSRARETLEGLLRQTIAACFITIAALTARRKEEIFDLGYGCIDNSRGDGAYWLTIYMEKTLQRYDLCPVPSIVNKSISILQKISEKARIKSGDDSLWQYSSPAGETIKLNGPMVLRALNLFYDSNIKREGFEDWTFSFHQFRRIFALLYFYRFEGAYIAALAHHLRHFNIEMTKRYITDTKFLKEMREIGEEWSASFLRETINGKRKLGGRSGEKIKQKFEKWASVFRKKVDVYERERIVAKLLRYMRRVGTEFTQQVWGTVCACPKNTSLSKHAGCANQKGQPEIERASIEKCGGCPFSIYTERFPSAVNEEILIREKARKTVPENSVIAEVQELKITSLENFLRKSESISPFALGAE
jgi:hypothetical protein